MKSTTTQEDLLSEMKELRLQLQEYEDTIQAIRTGQIDALVVNNGADHQLYTLRSADQTYRVFIEKMKEGAVTLNKEEIILYSNSQFASMVNLPLSEVIGVPFIDFVPDEFKEAFLSLISKGWSSDSKGEISLKNKKNTLIPFLLSFTSLELDEGRSLSIILTDLTVQKETEKQLKVKNEQLEEARAHVARMNDELEGILKIKTKDLLVSREHFRFLADNIPVIVWTTGSNGQADYFNKQWYEYTGLGVEESRGSGAVLALHPEDIDSVLDTWNNAISKKAAFQFEYRIKRASDGLYRWHLGKGEPFRDETGNIVAWFGTATDIEDQKKEIERKDEFISVASHELKTPLTSLKGYIQLMEGQSHLPEDTKLYIARGNNSINKLQHLINDLLDVSKIKAGKLEFEKNVVDLTELINLCIENSSYMYPAYNIQQDVEENLMVSGNAERLEQVLMNLINNAVKYSPGKKDIIVRGSSENNCVTVSVIDKGIGLSDYSQKRVFERFYRAENKNSSFPGLGMGLYICDELIKEHNGSMKVKSKLNEGSVFSFSLPLLNKAG